MQKEHCAVRLEPADMARVDALALAMTTEHVKVSRSSALRALVVGALPAMEKAYHVVKPVSMADPMRRAK